jgi:CRISPR system Cascade subunit CasC
MSQFIQLHLLTFFPPANLNRDDLGRPKTAVVGGATRLRLSSQSLKRAWRKSDVFQVELNQHLGDRTQRIGRDIKLLLQRDYGLDDAEAQILAKFAASLFGKINKNPKPGEELFIKQLAFISQDERRKIDVMFARVLATRRPRRRYWRRQPR